MTTKLVTQAGAIALLLSIINFPCATVHAQGALTPPGAPAPTMKSLDQIEARTPISSAPFTINKSGSYYLITNLNGIASTVGITVNADNVTIDLNGFALIGLITSSDAISASGANKNICIRNGSIVGWGGNGVSFSSALDSRVEKLHLFGNANGLDLGGNCVAEDCLAVSNRFNGINVLAGSSIKNCIASQNVNNGMLARSGSTVIGCVAAGNLQFGITVNEGVTIKNCSALKNTKVGISTGYSCTVMDCSSVSNLLEGISVFDGSTVVGCSVGANGGRGILANDGCTIRNCNANANKDSGIEVDAGTLVAGCTARGNTNNGINLTGANCTAQDNLSTGNSDTGIRISSGVGSRVEGNHCASNSVTGIRTITIGNLVFKNTAHGNAANYVFAASTTYGPTNAVTGGAISSTSSYDNFQY